MCVLFGFCLEKKNQQQQNRLNFDTFGKDRCRDGR